MKLLNIKSLLVVVAILCATSTCYSSIVTEAKLHYNRGVDFYKLGQYEQAATCFKQAVEVDPNYIDAYYNLGSILEYLKQDEQALNVFKQIILRQPEDYDALYKAAILSKNLGELEKANMYLSLIPDDGTMIAIKAKKLANSIEADVNNSKTSNSTNMNLKIWTEGVYENINSPTGLITDNNGNLFIAGFSENSIFKIGKDNKKIVYIKSEKIDGPIGLAIDSSNNIYIANYNKNNVLKVDKDGIITEFVPDVKSPYCLHINGDTLFVSSQGSNTVVRKKIK